MQIIIKGKQMEITPQLRQRIERKVQRLSRFVHDAARIEVTVAEERTRSAKDRYSVHLALSGNPSPIYSEVSALNASTALDLVLDKVVTQLGRQKDRYTTRKRHHTPAVKVLTLSRSGTLRSEEHTSELQSRSDLVCRLLLEKKKTSGITMRRHHRSPPRTPR